MPKLYFCCPLALTISLALSLAACSVIPAQPLPDIATPASYREAVASEPAQLPWKPAATETWAPAPWQVFALSELPGLLARQEAANASLAIAQGRYRQAAALIDQSRAGLFPAIGGSAGVARGRAAGQGSSSQTESLGLAASWEVDLWGRLRSGVEANEAAAKASAADLAGVRLSLQAQLVQALLSLRVVEVQRQLLEATVADYRRYVQLTGDRVRFGIASRADLAQAETQLRSVEAQAIETGVQRAQLEHAIAVLVGELPNRFQRPVQSASAVAWRVPLRVANDAADNAATPREEVPPGSGSLHAEIFALVPVLPVVPLNAPSTLLERRPDIAAAEQRVTAANAQIGVAQAAFFPVLSLAASGGQHSSVWADILSAPARFWSIGPALAAPLFDAGLRSAQKAQAIAAWDQAAATYRQTVLAAFQEVEDQLATLRILAEEAGIQQQAVKAARSSAELTLAQYRAGVANSLQAIVSNAALLAAERTALDLHNRRLTAAVTLVRALGGGWSE